MIGFGIGLIIWLSYQQKQRQNPIVDDHKTSQEKIILGLIFIGMLLLPLIDIFLP